MAKSKRQYTKVDEGVIEVRAGCPTCGSRKTGKDNGSREAPGYDLHLDGVYIGRHIKTRYVICECGQHYTIRVVEKPPKTEPAKKHSGERNVSEAAS